MLDGVEWFPQVPGRRPPDGAIFQLKRFPWTRAGQKSEEAMAKGTILVVEDEILLCWSLEEDLHREGYEVQIANTGNKGLAALEGGEHFDLLITNIRLKDGPDGWALARRARELRPDIPVLFVSGDSVAKHATDGVSGSHMLAKPYRPERLRQALASLLTHQPTCGAARSH